MSDDLNKTTDDMLLRLIAIGHLTSLGIICEFASLGDEGLLSACMPRLIEMRNDGIAQTIGGDVWALTEKGRERLSAIDVKDGQ